MSLLCWNICTSGGGGEVGKFLENKLKGKGVTFDPTTMLPVDFSERASVQIKCCYSIITRKPKFIRLNAFHS